ncbi:endo-1,4-beta-xylanase [Pullulanibacillus sp. KACC 23026]|uniref:endo-1,4-beta-xylanase n=1 Tax=Pullulanibacillus sp. KACC 23026 TaxID=3028315 RepID=UPI0023B010FD|nr:endo-1,4-beta-xylanase [Pullulanibacillus sp. KACC 23026]WEG11874.1 endo-1,4-beta-xylanase [Pullulanibacillus sp. KACC 23026]
METLKKMPSLKEVFKNDFEIGAAVNPVTLKTSEGLLTKHFSSLTSENHMKPEALQPKENGFTFSQADELVAFAKKHNMKVRGHNLVWHNQTPDWFFKDQKGVPVSRDQLLDRLKTHITTVVSRYKKDIYCWDVVNEAIADEGPELLRRSKWLEYVGDDFIEKAFEFAHDADPNALLFYNDYNETHPVKREKIYKLVKSLLDKGVPIHGVGLQGHWNLESPSLDEIREAIERYASLGLSLHITELDVSCFTWEDKRTELERPTPEMMEAQTKKYEQLFQLFKEYAGAITSVTFWGVADDYTWLNDFPVKGRKNWPFLFDANHQPKEAFWKVIDINSNKFSNE